MNPGGADGRGPSQTEPPRDADEHVTRHDRAPGVAAVAGLAESGAGEYDLVPGLPSWVAGGEDDPRDVDSGHKRIDPHDSAIAVERERVLVVDARVVHGDQHLAVARFDIVPLDEPHVGGLASADLQRAVRHPNRTAASS